MPRGKLDIRKPGDRAMLGWLGTGIVVLVGGAWAVVTYVWPAHHDGGVNCARNASIASSGSVSGNTITASGATLQANRTDSCGNTAGKP